MNMKSVPYSRKELFKQPEPLLQWDKTRGEYILVPCDTEAGTISRTGKSLSEWKDDIKNTISKYWSGPIVWRDKIASTEDRWLSFNLQLKNAHAVVGEGTISCTEAILLGTPAYTIDNTMSSLLMGGIENLSNIEYPDRDEWFEHICWSQFHLNEFNDGSKVADLVEQYQII